MSIDLSQFHQVFFEESLEGLDLMESALMELDVSNTDADIINTIFRSAHSIKGGSATFDFKVISDFTHVLETLLDQIRDGQRKITKDHVDLFLQSVDCLRHLLSLAQDNALVGTDDASTLQKQFESILDGDSLQVQPVANIVGESDAKPDDPSFSWDIIFNPSRDILQTGNDAVRLLSSLRALSDCDIYHIECDTSSVPSFEFLDPELCYFSWKIKCGGDVSYEEVHAVFEWVEDDSDITITAVSPENANRSGHQDIELINVEPEISSASVKNIKAVKPSTENTFIRVGIDKVDELINMVGELVITQSMLSQLSGLVDTAQVPRFGEGISQLEQNTRELQESVMRIRMLPISFSFNRFPRLVRDLSAKLNKNIDLTINGETTELDKTVMEKIGDPLVHLVRNAIDHGIEMPQDRIKAGKPPVGIITLNAFHQGGHVFIQITDDGKGLNKDLLLNKGLDKGLITSSQASSMSDESIYDLIFQPGFSTAKEVTDVSGRGVGMDVVKQNINALSGSVDIQSKLGYGSTITIRLPLTLAILDGQLIRVGDNIYIFPLVSIVESMECNVDNVSFLAGGKKIFKLRDEYVPIISLGEVFNVKPDKTNIDGSLMVVVEYSGNKVGVIVDELLAQQQVVIKSLEKNYQQVMGVSGATILGDGMVALILDVQSMVLLSSQKKYRN